MMDFNPRLQRVPSLEYLSMLTVVGTLLNHQDDTDSQMSERMQRLLETECFTAVSDQILTRLVQYHNSKLTNELVDALTSQSAKQIDLTACHGVQLPGLTKLLMKCPDLKMLNVSESPQLMVPDIFRLCKMTCPTLTSIVMSRNHNVNDEVVQVLLETLVSLRSLDISGCDITDRAFLIDATLQLYYHYSSQELTDKDLSQMRELARIDLSGCRQVSSQGIAFLTALCGPYLHHVSLSNTRVHCDVLLYLSGCNILSLADLLGPYAEGQEDLAKHLTAVFENIKSCAEEEEEEEDQTELDVKDTVETLPMETKMPATQAKELPPLNHDEIQVELPAHATFSSQEQLGNLNNGAIELSQVEEGEICCISSAKRNEGQNSVEEISGVCPSDAGPQLAGTKTCKENKDVNSKDTEMNVQFLGNVADTEIVKMKTPHEDDKFSIDNSSCLPVTDSTIKQTDPSCSHEHETDTSVLMEASSLLTSELENMHLEKPVSKTSESDCKPSADIQTDKQAVTTEIASASENSDYLACTNTRLLKSTKKTVGRRQKYKPNIVSLNIADILFFNDMEVGNVCLEKFFTENINMQKFVMTWRNASEKCIQSMSLRAKTLTDVSVQECSAIQPNGVHIIGQNCRNLRRVYLRGLVFIKDTDIIPYLSLKNLESLSLSESTVTDGTLIRLSTRCGSRLKELDLSWCEEITERGVNAVCHKCTNLQVLSLKKCPVSNLTIQLLLPHAHLLTELNLDSIHDEIANSVTDNSIISLAQNLHSLEKIVISWNLELTDVSIHAILMYCHKLREADMTGLKQITSDPFLPIISDLKRWRRCQALLNFKKTEAQKLAAMQEEQYSSDEEYEELFIPNRSSVYAPNLQELDLTYCDLVEDDHLAEIVAICRGSLQIIDYYNVQVEPKIFTRRK